MKIAVASGKGGTGKTTVATNLVIAAERGGYEVAYMDCDVEEPNGHIFLKPEFTGREPVGIPVPQVDPTKCIQCGVCGEICRYSAIVLVGDKVLVYPEMCHGCGGCSLVCPSHAVTEVSRTVGILESGRSGNIEFVHGKMDVGQVSCTPVIRAVKQRAFDDGTGDAIKVIDSPPGTSCPVIETVRDVDYVILVTEPTPFGFHDLQLAVEMVRVLKLPLGVVINRTGLDGVDIQSYCESRRIPILLRIPDDRRLAEAYSRGEIASQVLPEYLELFSGLVETVRKFERAAA